MNKRRLYYSSILLFLLGVFTIASFSYGNRIQLKKTIDKTNVTIWNIQGTTSEALDRIIDKYKTVYPNVNFIIKNYENEIYKKKIAETLITNEGPDIYFMWGYSLLQQFIKADMVLDITNEYTDIESEIIDSSILDGFTFDNKLYGIPTQGFNVGLYINEKIFRDNNLQYPKTYDELLKVIEECKSKDIIPISIGGKETWMLSLLYSTLVATGSHTNNSITTECFTTGEFKDAAEKLLQLVRVGAFGKDFKNDTVNQSLNKFMKGESAMLFAASFYSKSLEDLKNENVDAIDVISFPNLNGSSALEGTIAGYIDTFVINKNAKNRDLVVDIYKRLVKDLSYDVVVNQNNGLPVWKSDENLLSKDSIISKSYNNFQKEVYNLPYDIVFSKEIVNSHFTYLRNLVNDETTLNEFIDAHKKLNK